MINFGDITKIDGYKVPPVDCVIGGSPCQDLSIAGKRGGLDGARSGLFMEQIRVIKEMRELDKQNGREGKDIRPRYMVWENVPGAFSSNRGEDFRIVLEETAHIADEDAVIPEPEKDKNGRLKWSTVGSILGDGWSIAWRVLDAQFWGVPQRRRRISLVADFGGESAGEILFERKSVSGDSPQSGETRERVTGITENSSDNAVIILNDQGGSCMDVSTDVAATLRAESHGHDPIVIDNTKVHDNVNCLTPWDYQNKRIFDIDGAFNTLPAMGDGGGNNQAIFEPVYCLQCNGIDNDLSDAPVAIAYSFDSMASNSMKSSNPYSGCRQVDISKTLDCFDPNPSKNQGGIGIYQPKIYDMTHACDVIRDCGEKVPTLQSRMGTGGNQVPLVGCFARLSYDEYSEDYIGTTLTAHNGKQFADDICELPESYGRTAGGNNVASTLYAAYGTKWNGNAGAYNGDNFVISEQKNRCDCAGVDCRNFSESEVYPTLQAKSNGGQSLNYSGAIRVNKYVRRITPLECERLQGYPDNWTAIGTQEVKVVKDRDPDTNKVVGTHEEIVLCYTDENGKSKKVSDTARYRALGNSIAIPPWMYVLKNISSQYDGTPTMASLFDGIGGFPYIWQRINGEGTCKWISEIEEFPLAVTRERFE